MSFVRLLLITISSLICIYIFAQCSLSALTKVSGISSKVKPIIAESSSINSAEIINNQETMNASLNGENRMQQDGKTHKKSRLEERNRKAKKELNRVFEEFD